MTCFVAAFDDVVIKRYDKNRVSQGNVHARYVYAPKERVVYDLANTSQNITLPVISVSIAGIARDSTRVFNKITGLYFNPQAVAGSRYMRMPVPVNISVNMSILAKYQSDIDQILSNFIPYSNPYIIISWKIPASFGINETTELRSEVLWNDNIAFEYPSDVAANQKWRLACNTSFTIKGWIFPEVPSATIGNIFYATAHTYSTELLSTSSLYTDLTGQSFTYPTSARLYPDTETVALTGNTITLQISSTIY